MDPVIGRAGNACGLPSEFLHSTYPSELTMWIDPLEVSYRIGENGSICILYEYTEGVVEPWIPASLRNKKDVKLNKKTLELTQEAPKVNVKDALRMEYLLDPKKMVSIEQLATLIQKM